MKRLISIISLLYMLCPCAEIKWSTIKHTLKALKKTEYGIATEKAIEDEFPEEMKAVLLVFNPKFSYSIDDNHKIKLDLKNPEIMYNFNYDF